MNERREDMLKGRDRKTIGESEQRGGLNALREKYTNTSYRRLNVYWYFSKKVGLDAICSV